MRRAVVIVAFALCGGAACSLFVSTDGLQNGEASSDAGSGADAPMDVDASTPLDAGADALPEAGGPFCATHPGHFLCADFDEDAAVTTGWSTADLQSGGTIDLAFDASTSPPASFVAALPDVSSGGDGNARMGAEFSVAIPTKVHVELDVNLCQFSTLAAGAYFEIFKLAFGPGFDDNGLELQINNSTTYVKTDSPAATYDLTQKIVPFAWTHVSIEVVVSTSGSIVVTLNGTTALNVSGIDTTEQMPDAGYHAAVVGLYGTGSPACTSYFDNVLIDVN